MEHNLEKNYSSARLQGFQGYNCLTATGPTLVGNSSCLLPAPIDKAEEAALSFAITQN